MIDPGTPSQGEVSLDGTSGGHFIQPLASAQRQPVQPIISTLRKTTSNLTPDFPVGGTGSPDGWTVFSTKPASAFSNARQTWFPCDCQSLLLTLVPSYSFERTQTGPPWRENGTISWGAHTALAPPPNRSHVIAPPPWGLQLPVHSAPSAGRAGSCSPQGGGGLRARGGAGQATPPRRAPIQNGCGGRSAARRSSCRRLPSLWSRTGPSGLGLRLAPARSEQPRRSASLLGGPGGPAGGWSRRSASPSRTRSSPPAGTAAAAAPGARPTPPGAASPGSAQGRPGGGSGGGAGGASPWGGVGWGRGSFSAGPSTCWDRAAAS